MRWSERSIKSRLGRLSVAGFVVAVAIRFIHLHPAALSLLVLGVLAIFAWVWFLFILSGWQWLILDPIAIWGALVELGAEGIWTFENTTPKGWALYGLWIFEAFLTIVVPVAIVGTNPKPYCEACRTWTRQHLEPIW